ncbi:MAG: immunoglobulin domain-containing protein [Verrucomicrobia bacterium]|nr:immunoglobulin domain-containing protein [Verrucomicrobiota bacterium]
MNRHQSVSVLSLMTLALGASLHFAQAASSGPPVITIQPVSQKIFVGDPVSFSVVADGTAPLFYQWLRGGVAIDQANSATYTIAPTTLADHAALFSVIVSNNFGVTNSAVATLTIDPGIVATNTVLLVAISNSWRYNQSGSDLGTTWKDIGYSDAASPWASGPGAFDAKSTGARTTIAGETIRTQLSLGPQPAVNDLTTYYFRTHFNYSTNGVVSVSLRLNAILDDGAAFYLNGEDLYRIGVNAGALASDWATRTIGDAAYETFDVPATALVHGDNLLAVEVHQVNATSSDITFGLSVQADIGTRTRDTLAPTMQQVLPLPNSTVTELGFINVTFNELVTGVEAGDLLINNVPATGLLTLSPMEYQFTFPPPPTGVVTVAWATGHGIADQAAVPNAFAGGSWGLTLDPNALRGGLLISEFMADNAHGLRDDDGTQADWIEIYNPGPLDVNVGGWFLTDDPYLPTQWRFPDLNLGANKYLLVWASGKDRTNSAAPLHANFKLNNGSGYLALLDPRTNVASAFLPTYPAQQPDISYGRDRAEPTLVGYFATPTPGAQNSTTGQGFAADPVFSIDSGVYTNNTLTVTIAALGGTIRFTTNGTVPTASSPVYTGPITFSANTTIKARVFQTGLWPSAVGARTYLFLDSTTADFTSNLPLLIINSSGAAIQQNVAPGQARTPGSFVLIDTSTNTGRASLRSPAQFQGLAEFEIYGQTSAGFNKKPYNIEIQDELGNDRAVSLLGMPAEADWKLRNPYTDKCLMNDFLAFELYGQMGHYQLRRRFVEVFVDSSGGKLNYANDYHGVLVLLERIERGKDRVDITELTPSHTNEPAISGGYMWKKDKDSTGDLNFSTTGGGGFSGQGLKIHEPKARDITTAQLNWIRNYLNQYERTAYAANWLTATGTNHYSHYIDVDSFVDQHWIVEFTKQIDGYRLSSYFSKDRGGKIKWEPLWDWNLSFGNANYLQGGKVSGWYFARAAEGLNNTEHIWLRRLIHGVPGTAGVDLTTTGAGGDPDFNQKIADRWSVLRTNVLNGTNVVARIDQLAALLSEAAARDFAKFPRLGSYVWPNPNGASGGWDVDYQNPTTYSAIIAQMKGWTLGRYVWIDSQFTPTPGLSHPGGLVGPGSSITLSGPAGGVLYYTLDGTDPRLPGGAVAPGVLSNTGPANVVVTSNLRVVARAKKANNWYNTWSGPAAATYMIAVPPLVITEIMYHPGRPPAGNTNDADNFEFVELANRSGSALSLIGFRFTNGIDFTFTATNSVTSLAPGGRVLVVANRASFLSRYPALAGLVAGEYTGNLNNGGERLALVGPMAEPIHDFVFDNKWFPATDGLGFSLVVVNENAALNTWTNQSQWRPSAFDGGSPGAPDAAPVTVQPVLVNEILTLATPPAGDVIELWNPNPTPVDVGYWYLTDNLNVPKKFLIPPGTVLAGYGFVSFDETTSFGLPGVTNALGVTNDTFGLSSSGEEVFLLSGDSAGHLTGYYQGFDFGPAAMTVSFGRYINSLGTNMYVAQSVATLDNSNAAPRVGPVVINEIMYRPPRLFVAGISQENRRDEFVEIRNITADTVPLYDPISPQNTWRLEKGVDFTFPTGAELPPHGAAIVVGFNPAADAASLSAFRARYGLSDDVSIYGPYTGSLNNAGDRLELRLPSPFILGTGVAPMILVDRVDFSPTNPWPVLADGTGASLQRLSPAAFGNDPTNWIAAGPSAGRDRVAGTPPNVVGQPQPMTMIEGTSSNFTVSVSGTGPFLYQWLFNGQPLDGAFSPTLSLAEVLPSQAGDYSVYVLSDSGAAMSGSAHLTVRPLPVITQQPTNVYVQAGSNVSFRVTATGTGTISYRWQYNGIDLAGATSSILTLTNVQVANSGSYRVLVTDTVGARTSQSASLNVLVKPAIAIQPMSMTVAEGEMISLSVQVSGPGPLYYRPRRNSSGTNVYVGSSNFTWGVTNAALTNAGTYDVVVTNLANAVLGGQALSAKAYVVVVRPPSDQAAVMGGSATFRAIVGGPIATFTNRFQWLFGDTVLAEGRITNAALFTNSLVLTNLAPEHLGTYTFLLTNLAGLTNFSVVPAAFTATLAIPQPVEIVQQPTNQTAAQGGTAEFNVVATGTGPLSYQWWFNQTNPLAGANSAILTLTNVQPPQAGAFHVVVGNLLGSVTSAVATLTITVTTPPKFDGIVMAGSPTDPVKLGFTAQASQTYTVQYRDNLDSGSWQSLTNIGPLEINQPVEVRDWTALGQPQRFYRIRTPQQPPSP